MHLSDFVRDTSVVKDTLGGGRFTGVYVCCNTNISGIVQIASCHGLNYIKYDKLLCSNILKSRKFIPAFQWGSNIS